MDDKYAPKTMKTGDEITINFTTGGRAAKILLNGVEFCIAEFGFEMHAGQPSVVTVKLPWVTIPSQRGYFVAEEDMAEFLAWRLGRSGR